MAASFAQPDGPRLSKLLGEKCGMAQEPEDSLREKGQKRPGEVATTGTRHFPSSA